MQPVRANTMPALPLLGLTWLPILSAAALLVAAPSLAAWEPLFQTGQYFGTTLDAGSYRYGSPRALVVADFDLDGKPDITVGGSGGHVITLMHTHGSVGYQMYPPAFELGQDPDTPVYDVTTADLDLDGRPERVATYLSNPFDFMSTVIAVSPSTDQGFLHSTSYAIPGAWRLAAGDVNSDGRPDLVAGGIVGAGEAGIRVLFGLPGGALDSPVSYTTGISPPDGTIDPRALALADATGDGVLDAVLATATFSGSALYILQGAGDGTFLSVSGPIATEEPAYDVGVANLNGDAFPDLVMTAPVAGHVSIYLGAGGGTFQAPVHLSVSNTPGPLCVGDVDGDGDLDLVAVTKDPLNILTGVGVMKNDGLAGFSPAVYYVGLLGAGEAALADMNFDGRPDVVASIQGGTVELSPLDARTHAVGVLLNDGTGGFGDIGSAMPLPPATAQAVGDFNRDGIPDFVHASFIGIYLALGQGNGSFMPPTQISAITNAVRLFSTDMDRNGTLDLLVATDFESAYLSNDGSGTFILEQATIMGVSGPAITILDINRDGLLDVMTESGGFLTPYLSSAFMVGPETTYNFMAQTPFDPLGVVDDLVVGDWNRDGFPDVAMVGGGALRAFRNPVIGTDWLPSVVQARPYTALCAADFNRDGILDLAARETTSAAPFSGQYERGVDIFQGNGVGGFTLVQSFPALEERGSTIAAWDANRDGLTDIIATGVTDAIGGAPYQASADLFLNGDGQFGMRVGYSLGALSFDPLRRFGYGDIDRNGVPDLLAAVDSPVGGIVRSVLATPPPRGTGLLDPLQFLTVEFPTSIAVGDLNRDGIPDVVTSANAAAPSVAVMMGTGNGALGTSTTVPGSWASHHVALADLNRDGVLDIVSSNYNLTPRVSTMLGVGDGTFGTRYDYFRNVGLDFDIGDMNRDGIPDVVTSTQSGTGDSLEVLLGDGTGQLSASAKVLIGSAIYDVDLADLNRDGYLDAVVAAGSIKVLYGGAGSTLSAAITLSAPLTSCQTLCVADFNRDGWPDIAATNSTTGYIIWGGATTPFTTWVSTVLPLVAYDMSAGEAAADGVPYLYVTTGLDQIKILSVSQAGELGVVATAAAASQPFALALADFNRDGAPDVVSTGLPGSMVSVNLHGSLLVTAVDAPAPVPGVGRVSLRQNYPNPFNPRTTIRYSLPRTERVSLRVFDVSGRLVTTLRDGVEPAGERTVEWDGRDRNGRDVGSGVYLYRLSTESGVSESRRMVAVK